MEGWWMLGHTERVAGINLKGMAAFLRAKDLKPAKHPMVSVIDGGFDLTHPALKGVLRDTLAWNFLGNAQGESFDRAGTEAYREFKRLYPKYKTVKSAEAVKDTAEYCYYQRMAQEIRIQSYLMMAANQAYVYRALSTVDSLVLRAYPDKGVTLGEVQRMEVEDTTGLKSAIEMALTYCMRYGQETPWDTIVTRARDEYEVSSRRVASLEHDDDPHRRLGNNPLDFTNLNYGNADVSADAYHGTMVSGLLARVLREGGVSSAFIPLRAIPDGDEYDRDVAAALRWAVSHGAKVVNLSFGKRHSPYSTEVQQAIEYALEQDVLLVRAAGNHGTDNDVRPLHPEPFRPGTRERWPHMLVIGASNPQGHRASISCYGRQSVDALAPGEDITSAKPGGLYDTQRGTSLSAPIVAGVATVIRAYFPDLSAAQVRDLLICTARDSVVDAEAALRAAWRESRYGDGLFLQAERMNSDEMKRLVRNQTVQVNWLGGDVQYLYFTRQDNGEEVPTHYLLDKRTGRETRLFADPEYRYLSDLHLTRDREALAFRNKHRPMQYDWHTGVLGESTDTIPAKPREPWVRDDRPRIYSADSLYAVTALGHDLWLHRLQTGDSLQLSTDGVWNNSFALGGSSTRDRVRLGEASLPIGSWVGESHRFLCVREDKRAVGTLSLVNALAEPRPTTETYRFPMPGDTAVNIFRTYLVDAEKGTMEELPLTRRSDDLIDLSSFGRIRQEGDWAYLLQKSRYQDTITLWGIHGPTGEVRRLITEETAPHLCEQLFNYQPIRKGEEILWWSERTGRGQYYLYDGHGRLKNTITPPDLVAGQILYIDTLGRSLIFAGYGRENPTYSATYRYYYRVGFNGKGLTCLTPLPGQHDIELSPDKAYLVDHCSRMDLPPIHTLYTIKGRFVATLAQGDVSLLKARGRNLPQVRMMDAASSSIPLWGVVYTPWWMSSDDRLPIVSNPYPGPHMDLVPEAFTLDDNGNQTLADLGFIVLNYSYRGSNPLRGRDFYTYGYQNLRDYALADDQAVIRQLARAIPQADTTRVGIYGHSGGGFMAAAALLSHPDFYRVAVSASGNHDNNIYLKWWGETFHGRGRVPTNLELAPNLQGRLLLIHGDMDNNVHPAHTLRMAQALIKEGKRFDMLLLPGQNHGLGDRYYQNRIHYYLLEHLAGRRFSHIDILKHQ